MQTDVRQTIAVATSSQLQKYVKKIHHLNKIVTLSPLTPVTTHYHISNGAKLISINPTTQNFEYKLK